MEGGRKRYMCYKFLIMDINLSSCSFLAINHILNRQLNYGGEICCQGKTDVQFAEGVGFFRGLTLNTQEELENYGKGGSSETQSFFKNINHWGRDYSMGKWCPLTISTSENVSWHQKPLDFCKFYILLRFDITCCCILLLNQIDSRHCIYIQCCFHDAGLSSVILYILEGRTYGEGKGRP